MTNALPSPHTGHRSPAAFAPFTLFALLATVSSALLVTGCKEEKPEAPVQLRPVRFIKAENSQGARERTFSGLTHAGTESKLSFKVPGQVRKVFVNMGDKVKKRAPIAELDQTDFDLQLQQARASLASAQAQSRNAKSKYNQVSALYENGNAPKSDLDSARASREMADAQVRAAEKQAQLARQQLAYTRLRAPIAGSITMLRVEANENVSAGMPVVYLASGGEPEVTFAVPEALIAMVKVGQSATVTLDALAGKVLKASVSEVGAAASSGATFPVTVTLDDDPDSIKPGMAADVTITLGAPDQQAQMVLPIAAVGEDRAGRFVYVLKPGKDGKGTVHRTPVRIGDVTGAGIEILEGVSPGTLVVTAGVSRIQDGLEVLVPRG